MGTSTPLRSLYKPTIGETGWGSPVNANFDKLDGPKFTLLYGNDTPNNLTNNTDNYFQYTDEIFDELNVFSGSTTTVTIAESGLYRVGAHMTTLVTLDGAIITKGYIGIMVFVNDAIPYSDYSSLGDVQNLYGPENNSNSMIVNGDDEFIKVLNIGDVLKTDIYPYITTSGGTVSLSAVSFLTLEKIR